jgi:hypothetical protein
VFECSSAPNSIVLKQSHPSIPSAYLPERYDSIPKTQRHATQKYILQTRATHNRDWPKHYHMQNSLIIIDAAVFRVSCFVFRATKIPPSSRRSQ